MFHQRDHQIIRVLVITFILNLIVCVAKLIYGWMTHSLSLQADGFHSLLDSSSNIVGMIGVWMAARPPDQGHPYGHRKAEALASLFISFLIFFTCYEVITDVIARYHSPVVPSVGLMSFVIMVATMGINYGVAHYETNKGRELRSQILTSDAVHTHTDILVSLGVIISFIAVLWERPMLDWIIASMIVIFLLYAGFRILLQSINILLDAEIIKPEDLHAVVMGVQGIYACHNIRSRGSQDGIFIDMNIHVDPQLTTETAHQLTHEVIDVVKKNFPEVIEVLVHTEPRGHRE